MSEDMNLSVNGQSQVPPGFRFHPTEEELLHYYLRKKVAYEKIDLDVIRDVDLNKLEPWDIQERCKIGSTPQNDWYFFSHKDKKYPTGTRTNRATAAGFWKATGRDKVIHSSFRRIGMRKTLVFYKGRAPHGQKSDWIMHEYRLDDNTHDATANNLSVDSNVEEGWVVCRVFKKKNYHKALESPQTSSTSILDSRTQLIRNSTNDAILDQILQYMGRSCKQEINETINNVMINTNSDINNMIYLPSINTAIDGLHDRFTHLPRLESAPTINPSLHNNNSSTFNQDSSLVNETEPSRTDQGSAASGCNTNGASCTAIDSQKDDHDHGLSDWATFDRLVASQLNGQQDTSPNDDFGFSMDDDELSHGLRLNRPNSIIINQASHQVYSSEIDLWSFTRSSSSSTSSDPLCHLSV